MKLYGPSLVFLGRFLSTDSISLLFVSADFLFFHDSSLDRFSVFRNLLVFLDCPICWNIIVHSLLLNFCISLVSIIFHLTFLVLSIWVLSFFAW